MLVNINVLRTSLFKKKLLCCYTTLGGQTFLCHLIKEKKNDFFFTVMPKMSQRF